MRQGFDVHAVTTDVSSAADVRALAARSAALGRVRTVVHTAGVSPVGASREEIVAVDVVGTALVLDAFLEHAGSGTVVVCTASSSAGMVRLPPDVEQALAVTPTDRLAELPFLRDGCLDAGVAYCVAKRANQLRVAAASTAYGRVGARVVSVSPGVISTRMGRAELDGPSGPQVQAMIEASGIGRPGTGEEVAAAVDFLASPAASYITGTDLLVDGGTVAAARSAGLVRAMA